MTQQPDALQLADALEVDYYEDVRVTAAAAELRRLHALNEQARREWQGLTEEERADVAVACGCASADWLDFARAVEAALKEKNA